MTRAPTVLSAGRASSWRRRAQAAASFRLVSSAAGGPTGGSGRSRGSPGRRPQALPGEYSSSGRKRLAAGTAIGARGMIGKPMANGSGRRRGSHAEHYAVRSSRLVLWLPAAYRLARGPVPVNSLPLQQDDDMDVRCLQFCDPAVTPASADVSRAAWPSRLRRRGGGRRAEPLGQMAASRRPLVSCRERQSTAPRCAGWTRRRTTRTCRTATVSPPVRRSCGADWTPRTPSSSPAPSTTSSMTGF